MTAKPIDVVILTEDRYVHPDLDDWYQAQIAHEEALVGDALADSLHQQAMMHRVEVTGEVALDDPATGDTLFTTVLQLKLHRANRMMYATGRSEAIGSRVEIAFPYWLHGH